MNFTLSCMTVTSGGGAAGDACKSVFMILTAGYGPMGRERRPLIDGILFI